MDARRQEENSAVAVCADDIAIAVDAECHRGETSFNVQGRERSVRVAYEVAEVPDVVYHKSDGSSRIGDPVHVRARAGVRSRVWTGEIGEGVHYICVTGIREESQHADDFN